MQASITSSKGEIEESDKGIFPLRDLSLIMTTPHVRKSLHFAVFLLHEKWKQALSSDWRSTYSFVSSASSCLVAPFHITEMMLCSRLSRLTICEIAGCVIPSSLAMSRCECLSLSMSRTR